MMLYVQIMKGKYQNSAEKYYIIYRLKVMYLLFYPF